MENKMFTVKRYGAWMWIVINNETNLALRPPTIEIVGFLP